MDSSISINNSLMNRGYSKVVTVNDHHHLSAYFRRHNNTKFRRSLIIIVVVTAIILAAVIISSFAAGGALINSNTKSTTVSKTNPSVSKYADSNIIKTVCNVTHYPISCATSLLQHHHVSESANGGGGGEDLIQDVEGIFRLSLSITLKELFNLSTTIPLKLTKTKSNYIYNFNTVEDGRVRIESALRDCRSLVEDAVDKLETSISSMEASELKTNTRLSKMSDIRTWLSGALTDQDTCLDSLEEMMDANSNNNYKLPEETKTAMKKSREYTSNCLAIVSNFHTILRNLHRRR